jgi:hypothetical protein
MTRMMTGKLAAAAATVVFGAALSLTGVAPASAQLARAPAAVGIGTDTGVAATEIQYRRGWRGGRYYGGPRYYGPRRYYGGRYYRYGPGPGIAFGLATGAIVGGALAAQGRAAAAAEADAFAYCAQRFRSWDPETQTYLGYDGLRHPCP